MKMTENEEDQDLPLSPSQTLPLSPSGDLNIETDMEIVEEEQFESEVCHISEDLGSGDLSVDEAEEMLQELIDHHVVTRWRFKGEDEWQEVDESPEITLDEDGGSDDERMPGSVFGAQEEDKS